MSKFHLIITRKRNKKMELSCLVDSFNSKTLLTAMVKGVHLQPSDKLVEKMVDSLCKESITSVECKTFKYTKIELEQM